MCGAILALHYIFARFCAGVVGRKKMIKSTSWGLAISVAACVLFSVAQAQDSNSELADSPLTEADIEIAASVSETTADIFARDSFATRTIVCPFKGEVDYDAGEISCGMLSVPENREKTHSRLIELHFAKIHAKKPDDWNTEESGEWVKRDDPVVYLTGGPGVQAQGYVDRLKDHGIRNSRDLYILEQRGIGWSGDFCPTYPLYNPSAANSPEWEKYQRAALQSMDHCFEQATAAGADLTGYSTIENARDVEALRRALGYSAWNVWGISYGSILGQAYLKQDPDGILAAVIDAIVPLDQNVSFHNIARHYNRVLAILQEACDADSNCAQNFPDLTGRLEAAIAKTSMAPIEVDALDDELFPSGKAYFFQDIVGGAPFLLFYEQDNYATLPAFIDSYVRLVEKENFEPFRLLTAAGGGGGFGGISQGMYNAIACNDGWAASMRRAFEEDHADYPALAMIFGDASLVDEQARICTKHGLNPRPASDYEALQTDVRTLIVEGAMDPITPPPLAELILPGFSNGEYVEFAYAGHGPTRSVECAGDFLTKFFDNPTGELDRTCPESMEAPAFTGPLFETNAMPRLASLAAEDEEKMAMHAMWLGIPAIILIFGSLIYTVAPIARIVNRSGGHPTGGARLMAWLTALFGAAAVGGLAYSGYATFEANQFALLVGLLGSARWFAASGLLAGGTGLWLIWLTLKARSREALPIGVFAGLLLTGLAGIALAAWLVQWDMLPF